MRVRERVTFKMAVLVYRALHNSAPSYLSDFRRVADISRRSLRSASTDCLVVPRARLTTVGDRAFSVAGAVTWNCLPLSVTSAPTLSVFRSRLKFFLFGLSFPDLAC